MIIWIALLDAVALAVYFLVPLEDASANVKMAFTLAWTLVTLAVVLLSLRQIRVERDWLRRGP